MQPGLSKMFVSSVMMPILLAAVGAANCCSVQTGVTDPRQLGRQALEGIGFGESAVPESFALASVQLGVVADRIPVPADRGGRAAGFPQ